MSAPSNVIPFPRQQAADCCPVASTVAKHGQAIEDLGKEQTRVESALIRIEAKLDAVILDFPKHISSLHYWIMGALVTVIVALAGLLFKK